MPRDFGYLVRIKEVEKRMEGIEDVLAAIIERIGKLEKWRIPKKILESEIVEKKMVTDRTGRKVRKST